MDDVVASAPGRVNLIGEHLDYNGGRCLPIALPQRTRARVSARADGRLVVTSAAAADGSSYIAGVLAALGVSVGLGVDITSDVPIGAGLSSSAALECSVALAVDTLLGLGRSREELVAACIRAETEYAGAPTGGLDQTASLLCRQGHALLVDFATGGTEQVPFRPEDDGLGLRVVDTRVSHAHLDGGYGNRRAECEQAARILGVDRLVDAPEAGLEVLDDVLASRARHVLGEQARVDRFVDAARARDWETAGRLMSASHVSLRDDFEVSCPELDLVVDAALAAGALGARMTGGGFGGSAIVLVPTDRVATVESAVTAAFGDRGWRVPTYLAGHASSGAEVE